MCKHVLLSFELGGKHVNPHDEMWNIDIDQIRRWLTDGWGFIKHCCQIVAPDETYSC